MGGVLGWGVGGGVWLFVFWGGRLWLGGVWGGGFAGGGVFFCFGVWGGVGGGFFFLGVFQDLGMVKGEKSPSRRKCSTR